MSRPEPIPPHPEAPRSGLEGRDLIEGQIAILARLAQIGMGIAEAAGRRAEALAEGGAMGAHEADPGLTFARVARAVRLTLALQTRLLRDQATQDEARARARTTEAARRRDRIHTRVERAIEAERDDEVEAEQLSSHVWEQLTEADDADILDLPIEEAVARICRDLGLPADFETRSALFNLTKAGAPSQARHPEEADLSLSKVGRLEGRTTPDPAPDAADPGPGNRPPGLRLESAEGLRDEAPAGGGAGGRTFGSRCRCGRDRPCACHTQPSFSSASP